MTNEVAPQKSLSREKRFVSWVIQSCSEDSGFAAALARADNPATQFRSWPALAAFGVDLEDGNQREPYALVAAFLARRRKKDLSSGLRLGRAVLASYEYKHDSPAATARMRRLLSASSAQEACGLLRPMLALIAGRGISLDAALLLEDLCRFQRFPTRTKSRWAQDFYGVQPKDAVPATRSSARPTVSRVSSTPEGDSL